MNQGRQRGENYKKEILRVFGISKLLQENKILTNVNLSVYESEILGILSDSSPGKEMLCDILSGDIPNDSGAIYIENQLTSFQKISEAQEKGIYCINQESRLMSQLDVAENLCMVRSPSFIPKSERLIVKRKKIHILAQEYLDAWETGINAYEFPEQLRLEEEYLIGMLKAVMCGAKLIILNSICSQYFDMLFQTVPPFFRKMKENGISVIIVDSGPECLLSCCDRIVVLKQGRVTCNFFRGEFSKKNLVDILVESELRKTERMGNLCSKESVLNVELSAIDTENPPLSFYIQKGEVAGILDLEGDTANYIVDCVLGSIHKKVIKLQINGKEIENRNPRDAIQNGIGVITDEFSLFPNRSLAENLNGLILKRMSSRLHFISRKLMRFSFKEQMDDLGLQAKDYNKSIYFLSEKGKMKLVIRKWILTHPKVMILIHPGANMDLNHRYYLYEEIEKMCLQGIAILLISNHLHDIRHLCHRLYLVENHRFGKEFSQEEIRGNPLKDYLYKNRITNHEL